MPMQTCRSRGSYTISAVRCLNTSIFTGGLMSGAVILLPRAETEATCLQAMQRNLLLLCKPLQQSSAIRNCFCGCYSFSYVLLLLEALLLRDAIQVAHDVRNPARG